MKIGDYVRFKNGEIEKIHSFAEKDNPLFNILINARYHNINEIEKYGKLIDLIEVGDYVNGRPVLLKENNELVCGLLLRYKEENIEDIVTKEQFESMKYEVE